MKTYAYFLTNYLVSLVSKRQLVSITYFGAVALVCYVIQLHLMELRTDGGSFILNGAPNFLAVPITCAFAFLATSGNKSTTAFFCALGIIGYEFIQLDIDERTFDVVDIVFSVFGYGFMHFAIAIEQRIIKFLDET